MRDTLVYIFLLILISSLPDIINIFLLRDITDGELQSILYLQAFIVYPLYVIFMGVVAISLIAFAGYLIKNVMKRRLTYHHLWKMTAYAATVPLILNLVEKLLRYNHFWINLLLLLLLFFYLYKMIAVYPVVQKNNKPFS